MTMSAHRPKHAPSDGELIAAIARGDLEALGQLFEQSEPMVRRYFGRIGIPACDADDLIQATFLEVLRAAARFDATYAASTWLFGIATMMARRHRRSLARAAARLAEWTRLARRDPPLTPAVIFEGDAAERRIAAALERLAPKKREVFVLVTLEGMNGEDAAAALGVPLNTVWPRLHHARRELRRALEEADDDAASQHPGCPRAWQRKRGGRRLSKSRHRLVRAARHDLSMPANAKRSRADCASSRCTCRAEHTPLERRRSATSCCAAPTTAALARTVTPGWVGLRAPRS